MREIKFRAWSEKRKEFNLMDLRDAIGSDDAYALCGDQGTDWAVDQENSCTMNCKCELQQFTGLKDKNGVDIYEGDIVKVDRSIAIIKWIDYLGWDSGGSGHPGFYPVMNGYEEKSKLGTKVEMEYTLSFYDIEVIGNIYENKELVENGT